ncbi:putative quinol monooxygenase [Actibacterium ureilyticum]|uniref:putative quinol monooxygenase n=1 Tax=Actibacterium ureilyticum TaxID=1590614 RepID=UPI000BAADC12|nr:putative quinol monooxygenase [Actibacterium ureilyticum]
MTLSVFATITPKPEFRDQVEASLKSILAPTREEPGCHRFELHAGNDGDANLYLVETWQDEAALQAHYAEPYITSVFASYGDWLAHPPAVIKMTPVA